MKEIMKQMLEHPFATVIILGAVGSAIASIVSAARGIPIKPLIDVSFSK